MHFHQCTGYDEVAFELKRLNLKTLSFDGIFEQKKLNTFGSTAFGGPKKVTYSNGYHSSGYVSSGGTKDPVTSVKKVLFNPNTGTNTYLPSNPSNASINVNGNGNGSGNGNSTTPTQVSYAMSSSIIKKSIVPVTPTPSATKTLTKKALKKEIRKEKLERRATETTDDEAFIPVRSKKNAASNGSAFQSIDANKVCMVSWQTLRRSFLIFALCFGLYSLYRNKLLHPATITISLPAAVSAQTVNTDTTTSSPKNN